MGKTLEQWAAEVEALAEQLVDAVTKLTNSTAWLEMSRWAHASPATADQLPAAVDAGRAVLGWG